MATTTTDSSPKAGRPGLVRSSGTISIMAGFGVMSGFLVDATVAALFGVTARTDAFFIAATIPFAMASVLLASTNQALVPLLNGWLREDTAESKRRTEKLFGTALVVGVLLAAIGILASPVITSAIGAGASDSTRALASQLSMILFFTVITRVGAEVLRAMLNAKFSFGAPAAMPVLENAGVLIVVLVFGLRWGIIGLAWGYAFGGILQFLFMAIVAWKNGLPLRPRWGFSDPEIRRSFRLLSLPVGQTGINMFARMFERFLVSFLAPGSITILNYAWVIVNSLGGAVFFRSVVVALLPRLAEKKNDPKACRRILRDGTRIMVVISVPLAILTAILAQPLISLAFQRGEFTASAGRILAGVLAVYALSFPLDALTRAFLTFFYGRLDMLTPFKNGAFGVASNIALAALLFMPLGVSGIALAYVLSSVVNVTHAYLNVRRQLAFDGTEILVFAGRILVASALAGAVALGVGALIEAGPGVLSRIIRLGVPGAAALLALVAATGILRVWSLGSVRAWLRRTPRPQITEARA